MGARSGPDLADALPRFLLRCEHEVARRAYRTAVRRFLAWADGLEPDAVERYVEHLRAEGVSEATVRWRARVVAEFLEYARERGLLGGDAGVSDPEGGER
jgi:hypothetical protein